MDTQMDTPMPRSALTGVPSWTRDAQAAREAPHVALRGNACVTPESLPTPHGNRFAKRFASSVNQSNSQRGASCERNANRMRTHTEIE